MREQNRHNPKKERKNKQTKATNHPKLGKDLMQRGLMAVK
jgi:hypothetical protein